VARHASRRVRLAICGRAPRKGTSKSIYLLLYIYLYRSVSLSISRSIYPDLNGHRARHASRRVRLVVCGRAPRKGTSKSIYLLLYIYLYRSVSLSISRSIYPDLNGHRTRHASRRVRLAICGRAPMKDKGQIRQ